MIHGVRSTNGRIDERNDIVHYTAWLRRQVMALETEIREHPVFESGEPATAAQLEELRRIVVIHTFLRQQLLRREVAVPLVTVAAAYAHVEA